MDSERDPGVEDEFKIAVLRSQEEEEEEEPGRRRRRRKVYSELTQ